MIEREANRIRMSNENDGADSGDALIVQILFFAQFRERLNTAKLEWALDIDQMSQMPTARVMTVDELRQKLMQRGPIWAECLGKGKQMVAINQVLVNGDALVKPGDEVAFFPPVTGG